MEISEAARRELARGFKREELAARQEHWRQALIYSGLVAFVGVALVLHMLLGRPS